jgi:hypothetical protein
LRFLVARSLYCIPCDTSVWSSSFYAEGAHRCPDCNELLTAPAEADEPPAPDAAFRESVS